MAAHKAKITQKQYSLKSEFKPCGDQPNAIKTLTDGLNANNRYQTLLGVTGSGKTFTVANIIAKTNRPAIILAHNKTLAAQLYGEMKEFFPNNRVEYFVSYYDYYQPEAYVPSSDTFIEKDAAINDHIEQMRLSATKAILERSDTIIVATVSAIYGLGDPNSYLQMLLHISRGDIIDQRDILRKLADLQYTRNDIDFQRATYRVKGDVIDIFPAESEYEAVRVELFGDEIDNIAYFDPLTGEILRKIPRVSIYPKSHYVTPKEQILKAVDAIKAELKTRVKELESLQKLVEMQRLKERAKYDIEMLLELGYCSGIENYSRYLTDSIPGSPPPTLMDYLPKDTLLFIDESHVTVPQLGAMYRGDFSRKTTLVEYGFRLPSAMDNRPLKFEEFCEFKLQTIYISATPGDYELAQTHKRIVEQVVRPTGLLDPTVEIRPVNSQVEDVLNEINDRVKLKERILITTLTKKMSEDLTDYLFENGVKVRYLHSDVPTVERVEIIRELRMGKFDVLVGINLLREGLDIPEVSLVAILDADKEGFLRSTRSLIQTIGRAARHINGKAILYADKKTKSIEQAIKETERRRKKQTAYNKQHNITPTGIKKAVHDVMEGAYGEKGYKLARLVKKEAKAKRYKTLSAAEINKKIKALEKEMHACAENLEFEQAAQLRDEIRVLNDQLQQF